jgi:hypothetical protein
VHRRQVHTPLQPGKAGLPDRLHVPQHERNSLRLRARHAARDSRGRRWLHDVACVGHVPVVASRGFDRKSATMNRRIAFAATALTTMFIALHIARLPEPLGVDQGLFACYTRWIARGWLPYRDLFDSKPPLFLYWWGLARIIPGDLPRAIWWFEALWLTGAIAVTYALSASLFGRRAALASSALLVIGLWSPTFGAFWSRAQAEEALALPMLASAWHSLRALDRDRNAVWCGVLAGICGLFKIPAMAIGGAWALTFFMVLPRREAVRRTVLLGLGVAAPWIVAVTWFAMHRSTRAFIDGVFVYHRHNAAFIAPPWGAVLPAFVRQAFAGAAFPIVAAIIGIFLLARRRSHLAVWLAAWGGFTMAAVALQRQLAGYHFLLFAPPLAIAGGYGCALTLRALFHRGRPRIVAAGCAIALVWTASGAIESFVDAYRPGWEHIRGSRDRRSYLAAIQQGSYSNITEEELGSYIAARTTADQGVLVWGLSPGVYPLADRHPVTRFPFHKILYTDAPLSRMIPGLAERRADLLERIRKDPPAYIVVGQGDQNGFEPLDSQTSLMRFPELRVMVENDYLVETRIGRFVLHRRK